DAAAAVDERIEHQVQELIGELEADLLRIGSGFAGELAQRAGKIAAGEAEDSHEGGRQRAAGKKLLSTLATLHWLTLKGQASGLGLLGCPSVAVRFKIASVAV